MKVLVVVDQHRDVVGVATSLDAAAQMARDDFECVAKENDMDAQTCSMLIFQDEKRYFEGDMKKCHQIIFPHPTEDYDAAWYYAYPCEVREEC